MSKQELGKLSVFLGVFALGVILGFVLSFFGALVVVGPEYPPEGHATDDMQEGKLIPTNHGGVDQMVDKEDVSQ
ncbi:hypothetical protein H6758_00825 [Candidatus Nomurabacteria bacterium]|nr:hypothetical protein [Candidatus Nomurabacteria bacterium]